MQSYPPTYERLAESYYQAFSDLQSFRSKWESRVIRWLLPWLVLYVILSLNFSLTSWAVHLAFLTALAALCASVYWRWEKLNRRVNAAMELWGSSRRALEDYQARRWLPPPAAIALFEHFVHLGNDIKDDFISLDIPVEEKIKLSTKEIQQHLAQQQAIECLTDRQARPAFRIHDHDVIRGIVLSKLESILRLITRSIYPSAGTYLTEACQEIETFLNLPNGTIVWEVRSSSNKRVHVVELVSIMLQQDYAASLGNILGDAHYPATLSEPTTRALIDKIIIELHLTVHSL
jgi:hypothetical protein